MKKLLVKMLAGGGVLATVIAGATMFAGNASAMTQTAGGPAVQQTTPTTPTTTAPANAEQWPAAIEGRPTKLDNGSA
ncbi:MAG TPA: hypothetical protein VN697_10795, partial [Tepidiformaceae bacterium]|nr:hypothetical protein [Tepidiformaceae bacterium]